MDYKIPYTTDTSLNQQQIKQNLKTPVHSITRLNPQFAFNRIMPTALRETAAHHCNNVSYSKTRSPVVTTWPMNCNAMAYCPRLTLIRVTGQ